MKPFLFVLLFFPVIIIVFELVRQWHIYKRAQKKIFLSSGLTGIYILYIYLTQKKAEKSITEDFFTGLNWWDNILDPLIGIAVLTVTISIWLYKVRNEWEDDLEHRLSVSYIYENQEIMRCEHAVLSHEADIRAWAQHIGSQMVDKGNYRLKLEPYFKKTPPVIEQDQHDTNKRFKHHYFALFLYELPENLNGLSKEDLRDFDHIEQDKIENVLVWKILNRKSIDEKTYDRNFR